MNDQEIIEKALETLENVNLAQINEIPATVQRLQALMKATERLPWEEVSTLSVGWKAMDTGSGDIEILPTLDIVMREQMS